MNSYKGEIIAIEQDKHLSLVKVRVGEIFFTSIVIGSSETSSYLKTGKRVRLLFKETEVLIGKNTKACSISLQNKMNGAISRLEAGKLLSKLEVMTGIGKVVSIITTHAVEQLQLKEGDEVTAMIKTNEIMLEE